jgi:hypothetical protein
VRGGGNYSFDSFPPTTLTLSPGKVAYFNLGYHDIPYGTETCPSATALEVTPPNAYDHLTVDLSFQPCDHGTLEISPVFAAGGSGSQTTAPPGKS